MSLLPFLIAASGVAITAGICCVRLRSLRREAEQVRDGHYDNFAGIMGGLVLRFDGSGMVTSVSSNCEDLFGVQPGEILGRGFFERVQVADRPAFLKTISDARAGAAAVNAALRWRGNARVDRGDYAEPVFLWLEMRARRGDGSWNGDAIAIVRDVTGAKRATAELEDAGAAGAGGVAPGQDNFLVHAGHELRTPLNAIVGFSELLGDPRLTLADFEKQREYARIIHQSGLHLLAVVNAILNMSKIQSGALSIALEPFAVAPLIDLCCDMVKLRAKTREVELLRAYPENLDEITGDKQACAQILINLLSNAIKFTPPHGSVTISALPEAHCLRILVADTGIGIAARDLTHLGDPFFQAKAGSLISPDQNEKGTGLGLSIVRGLVGLQGGTITVASEPGREPEFKSVCP